MIGRGDNYISVHAIFIGEDGSMGFQKNRQYELHMSLRYNQVIIQTRNPFRKVCPYDTMKGFLKNWKIV